MLDALIGWPGGDWQTTLKLAATLTVAYLLLLWLASVLWSFRDMRARTLDPVSQIIGVALVTFVLASSASAQFTGFLAGRITWDDRSLLTFSGPVSLPSVTLPAGTYLFRFPSLNTSRDVIQVLSEDRKNVFAMVYTIPAYRQTASNEIEVVFKETRADLPRAIQAIFPPFERTGYEFVYPNESGSSAEATGTK